MLIHRLYQKLIPDNSPDRFKNVYLILAAVCLAAILTVSMVVINWHSKTDLKDTVIANSERIVDSIYYTEVEVILIHADANGSTITLPDEKALNSLDARIRDMYDPLNIVKVIIFNRDQAAIYGNDKKIIELSEYKKQLNETFEKGQIVYHLSKQRKVVDLVGEQRIVADMAEVYIPIKHKSGQIMGAFAVYSDVSNLTHKYKQQMIHSVLAQTIMLLFISIISYIVIIRESSELKLAYQQLQTMAITDPLTGVHNRRHLMEWVEKHFAMLQRNGDRLSGIGFVMIDVDYFKQINDTYGHLAGDRILQELATEIKLELRQYDVFGRYGGEEFLIVLPDTLPEETKQISERLITSVREHAFEWDNDSICITLSAGVTWTDAANETLDDVLSRVDSLMYKAKERGRNQIVFS